MNTRYKLVMSQVMLPHQANVAGNVHGGEIMKFMDTAAGACAMKYAKGNCVTARVDELVFHLPILVGALVTCTASVVYVGNTSMDVYVEVESEDMESSHGAEIALSAHFTMVCMNKTGRPQSVPSYAPETEDEKVLYNAALERVAAIKKAKPNPNCKTV
ncbi:MAG: acyl-CoA thioesterase [Anaerovoracaceae bacterium]